MMQDWGHAAALAVRFLTRLPVPGEDPARFGQDIGRALPLFPWVGALVGALAAVPLLFGAMLWPLPVAVLLALALEARLTGALHEDAVADLCDALGGGRSLEDRLRILKDSRVGSYGVLGLGLAVALRASGLMASGEAWRAAAILVVAGGFGRLLMLATMVAVPTVPNRTSLAAGVAPRAGWGGLLLAMLLFLPLLALGAWISAWGMLVAFGLGAGFLLWFRGLLLRLLGGSTGDTLGFAAYAGMLIATLALAARL
jgi:adenosylcobinamide-GDP ribazoletransferase